MKRKKSLCDEQQLSLYIDGMLDEHERRSVEQAMEADAELRRRVEELKRLKTVLSKTSVPQSDPSLVDRTLAAIYSMRANREKPQTLTHRSIPAFAGLAVLLLITVGIFTWMQRTSIIRYVRDTGDQVQHVYEASIKGWIMPLFQRTNHDQILEFALFGVLPLDAQDGTVLRVDPHRDLGYSVELASNVPLLSERTSVAELYDRLQPTEAQRRTLDTLFHMAQRQIESSVLIDDEQRLAIDPDLPRFQRLFLSGIAASLTSEQRRSFENFLNERNTSYMLAAAGSERDEASDTRFVVNAMRQLPLPEDFVLVAHDSVSIMKLRLNMDSIRLRMQGIRDHAIRINLAELANVRSRNTQEYVLNSPVSPHVVRILPPTDQQERTAGLTFRIEGDAEELQRAVSRDVERLLDQVIVYRHAIASQRTRTARPDRRQYPREFRVSMTADSALAIGVSVDSILRNAFQILRDGQHDAAIDQPFDFRIDANSTFESIISLQTDSLVQRLLRQHGVEDDAAIQTSMEEIRRAIQQKMKHPPKRSDLPRPPHHTNSADSLRKLLHQPALPPRPDVDGRGDRDKSSRQDTLNDI